MCTTEKIHTLNFMVRVEANIVTNDIFSCFDLEIEIIRMKK